MKGINKRARLLMESIWEKWIPLRDGEKRDNLGDEDCPLCKAYNNADTKNPCSYCPIKKEVGESYCGNTPYCNFNKHRRFRMEGHYCEECKTLAQKEIDFLYDLYLKEL